MTANMHPRRFRLLCGLALLGLCLSSTSLPAQARSEQTVFTDCDAQAQAMLARMTLDEKIGQMMEPDQGALADPSDIATYHLGSLLSGGGSGPRNPADYTLTGWRNMVDGYQKVARGTRLGIPLLYGIDAVHGNNNIPGAVIFPHNIGLGCTRDPALVQQVERVTAEEVRATDVNLAFGPCVTVPQDIRWGRTYEGYSADPQLVRRLAGPAVQGFQGKSLADPLSVAACAKHYVGDGGTTFMAQGYPATGQGGGRLLDQGDTRVDDATLRRIHLQGYVSAVNAGVGVIMPSYSSWNGVRCSASKYLLTTVLKGQLGFQGFLLSDYNAIDEIGPDYKSDIAVSVNAGMDMVMMTDRYPEFFADLKSLVQDGTVPLSRINDAVTRILRVKIALGLLGKDPRLSADPQTILAFGSAAHRQVALRAVRESLVLLKNTNKTLPLKKSLTRIVVAGRGADNIGMQCGGWTTSWQGSMNNTVPGGTTILQAIKNTAPGAAVTVSPDGTGARGADVGIVVIGETPYAEGRGDRADLSLSPEDLAAVSNLKAAGIPVVVVLLSGRPMILGPVLDQADALVAAWLPGSEGQGVADVLFGSYRPTGKLSFPWPRTMAQLPLHWGDKNADPLFPYGYGLTY